MAPSGPAAPIRIPLEKSPERTPASNCRQTLLFLLALAVVWLSIAAFVNPLGEFMINDDWSFQSALEDWTAQGRIQSTGWGPKSAPGGPALIFHLAWGRLFQFLLGASSSALRISILIMGILCSIGLFLLLSRSSPSLSLAFWAALTLVLNPLFLSQCFTFMSDITFTGTAVFSLWFLYLGIRHESRWMIAGGLAFALCSVLTRQLALVIPAAFCITCLVYRHRLVVSPWLVCGLTLVIVIAPWLGYEFFLFSTGGTPLTQHQVFQRLWLHAQNLGLGDYLSFLGTNIAFTVMYVSWLISPVLALRYRELMESGRFMIFLVVITVVFLMAEAALLFSWVDLPVTLFRNVIFDLGLGPIVLKDTYLLGIRRSIGLPSSLYCLVLYMAVLSVGGIVYLVGAWLKKAFTREYISANPAGACLQMICFTAGLMYVVLITLSGFHDRYLIIMCVFGIIWIASNAAARTAVLSRPVGAALGLVPLLAMGFFSVAGLHDFMALKRAQKSAQDYVVHDLGVAPCDFDGGFEFNAYHCYRTGKEPREGLSWWWVQREKYLVTLGPLPGYEVIRVFPFNRMLGGANAIHVLKPMKPPAAEG